MLHSSRSWHSSRMCPTALLNLSVERESREAFVIQAALLVSFGTGCCTCFGPFPARFLVGESMKSSNHSLKVQVSFGRSPVSFGSACADATSSCQSSTDEPQVTSSSNVCAERGKNHFSNVTFDFRLTSFFSTFLPASCPNILRNATFEPIFQTFRWRPPQTFRRSDGVQLSQLQLQTDWSDS